MKQIRYEIDQLIEDKRVKIVHAEHPYMDYTLCGMALEGMGRNNEHTMAIETTKKITCVLCIKIINHCKQIKI